MGNVMTSSPSPKKRAAVVSANNSGPVPGTHVNKENSGRQGTIALGEKRKHYSPLSARGLYNLTTSPIINRTLSGGGDHDGGGGTEGSAEHPPPAKKTEVQGQQKTLLSEVQNNKVKPSAFI